MRAYAGDDDLDALGCGVKAIGLQVFRHGIWVGVQRQKRGEEAGGEENFVLGGKVGVDGVELGLVVGTEVARGLHADQKDGDVLGGGGFQDGVKVGACLGGVDAAEHVVAAEGDDQGLNLGGKGPVEAGQAAGGGVARDARVLNGDGLALAGKPGLQLRDEAIFGGKAIALREAVAQGGDGGGVHGRGQQ